MSLVAAILFLMIGERLDMSPSYYVVLVLFVLFHIIKSLVSVWKD